MNRQNGKAPNIEYMKWNGDNINGMAMISTEKIRIGMAMIVLQTMGAV